MFGSWSGQSCAGSYWLGQKRKRSIWNMPGSPQKCWKGWRIASGFFFFFGNSSKIMLTNCLDKDSGQTPISPAATLTPGALLCGHYISPDAEAVFHPHRLPVSGSSALHGLHAGTRAGRSQYLEFNHSLWQRELARESLSPAVEHLSQKSDSHFCS